MLDAKSLAVLQSLKSDIKVTKPVLEGTIKGTGRSFGFVISSDGDELFLPPKQMERVFPGDEVTFTVIEMPDGKRQAELETLIRSNFLEFNGLYQSRGKAQGIQPFNPAFSGWLFVPPKHINGSEHQHLVSAKVIRHPWETGKAQAQVVQSLGSSQNNRSWYNMALQEHDIDEHFSTEELTEASRIADLDINDIPGYEDLTQLNFVSIDAKSTLDVDDALFATATETGWNLSVAIADVSAFIEPGSVLFKTSQKRMTTTYLPGLTVPMLPNELSHNAFSLLEDKQRLALVFTLSIAQDGTVTQLNTQKAIIKNHAKLSYVDVEHWLESNSIPEHLTEPLNLLASATDALARWRKANANVMHHRVDYRLQVDDNFDVLDIVAEPDNKARNIVEEAMVATNYSIANWLKGDSALFMTHQGFRPDRETELKGLLRDYAPEAANLDGNELSDFQKILRAAANTSDFPLLSLLQKRFERSQWSSESKPHFGLGLPHYTNGTSPIRKFADLCIHNAIKQKLKGETVSISQDIINDINDRGFSSRQVSKSIETRLSLTWLGKHEQKIWDAKIVHINANGLIMQLNDNGISGFLSLRNKKGNYSYDALRMQLKNEETIYQIGQPLRVQVLQCDDNGLTLDFETPLT